MLWNGACIYRGLLVSHSLLLLCGIPIWGMKGVQLDYNIFPSREIIVTSLTYLALDGWKDLSVSWESCFCLFFFFFWKVLSICVTWYVCKSCLFMELRLKSFSYFHCLCTPANIYITPTAPFVAGAQNLFLRESSHLGLDILMFLTLSLMSGNRSLHLFPSSTGRSFSHDGLARRWLYLSHFLLNVKSSNSRTKRIKTVVSCNSSNSFLRYLW